MRNNNSKMGITIIVAFMVLVLGFIFVSEASANLNKIPTLAFTATPSLLSTPIPPTTMPTQIGEYVTQIELVHIIEKVTTQHLNTINLALGIVGIGLAIVGVFSINVILKIQKVAAESQDRLAKFSEKEKEWNSELQKVGSLTNLYIFILELRDPNPDLRRRALQRLRASSDIMAVSHVSYLLLSDPDSSIRAEAALSLNDLLPEGVEEGTLIHAVGALTKGLIDKEKTVVHYSIKTLATLLSRGEPIPLSTLEKLREISNSRDKNLAQAANDALAQSTRKQN